MSLNLLTLPLELLAPCLSPLHPHQIHQLRGLSNLALPIITSITNTHAFITANLSHFLVQTDSDMTSAEVPIYIKHIKSIRWNHISPMYLSVMFEMMLGKAPLFCINMLFLESPFRENKTEKFKRESVYAVAVTSALKVTFKAFNVDLALCPQDIFNWFAIMDDADFMDHLIKLLQNLEDDSRFALHQAVSYAARHGSSSVLKLFLKKDIRSESAVADALAFGQVDVATMLLDSRMYRIDEECLLMPASFGMKDMMVWAIERSDTPFGDDVFAAAMTRAASHGHSNIVEYIMSLPSVDLSPHHAYANALTSAVRASQAGVVETLMGVPDLVDAFAEADEFFRRKVLGIAVIGMSLKRERCTLDALLKSRMFATTDVEYILKAFCHGKAVECTLLNYLRV